MFQSASEVINWIENIHRKERRKDLSRIETILDTIGRPQDSFKIIHIAGTNGKGSTAAYFKECLISEGYKVGFFTSPYLIKFNERIMINNSMISDEKLLNYANYLYPIIKEYEKDNDDIVPFFEVVTILGMYYFKEEKIDYAVVECGLGGRLDATNFVDPIASIITSVGLDHQNTLGESILDIAYHKAGIIKPQVPIFTVKNDGVMSIIEKEAIDKKAPLIVVDDIKSIQLSDKTTFVYKDEFYETPLLGKFQAFNMALVIEAYNYLFGHRDASFYNEAVRKVFWPGRFEYLDYNLIIDGAHNVDAIKALVDSLKELDLPKITCVFTALKDKNYPTMLKVLDEVVDNYRFVAFNDSRGLTKEAFVGLTSRPYSLYDDYKLALDRPSDGMMLVTGSLHFISCVRRFLKK